MPMDQEQTLHVTRSSLSTLRPATASEDTVLSGPIATAEIAMFRVGELASAHGRLTFGKNSVLTHLVVQRNPTDSQMSCRVGATETVA